MISRCCATVRLAKAARFGNAGKKLPAALDFFLPFELRAAA
jgi:hypothetical protein